MTNETCCNCSRTKVRTAEEKKSLENRINRIIGQLGGVKNMIEDDHYCDDILTQLSAIDKSVKSLAVVLLDAHMHSCLIESIKSGDMSVIDEILTLFKRFQ